MKPSKHHLRAAGLVVLAGVTVWGAYQLATSDRAAILDYWRSRTHLLAIAMAFQACDISIDCLLWLWILRLLGIRIPLRRGGLIFLSGYAGLLLPAQTGRFIRSDAIERLGLGALGVAVKGELTLLFLSGVAAIAVLAGIVAYVLFPPLAVVAVIGVVVFFLLVVDRVFAVLSETPVHFPRGFWRRWEVFAIAGLAMTGWILNGTSLYLVVHDLPGHVQYIQALFAAPANLLLATGTGLPGGIGAIEGFLGVSLSLMDVPAAHLALAVGAFRLVTFWLWIPVGWAALLISNRLTHQPGGSSLPGEAPSPEANGEESAPEQGVIT